MFQAGTTIISNIEFGIDRSKFMAILITPNFMKSAWLQFEVAIAKTKEADISRPVCILELLLCVALLDSSVLFIIDGPNHSGPNAIVLFMLRAQ